MEKTYKKPKTFKSAAEALTYAETELKKYEAETCFVGETPTLLMSTGLYIEEGVRVKIEEAVKSLLTQGLLWREDNWALRATKIEVLPDQDNFTVILTVSGVRVKLCYGTKEECEEFAAYLKKRQNDIEDGITQLGAELTTLLLNRTSELFGSEVLNLGLDY